MNDNVQVSITATDEGATSVISSFEQRLVALETAYKNSAGAADITSAAVKGSGDAASVATGKWEGLGAALEQMSGHARTVGIALNAAGMETGAAVAKIDGLAAAFKGLQAATGPLLVALLGLEALTKVFEFFKDGAAEAAQMQANMNSLAASVESQGKQWESLRDGVEQWLDTESIATGFLQSELLPALNQLVSDGRDVHDAEIMASVGAEIARDKHISLEEAVNAVAGAFVGLNRGVLIHDEGLRRLIKTGSDEQQILNYLHDKYKRAINDHNDAKVAADRQHAVYTALAEQVGRSMLPMMQYLSEALIGVTRAGADFASSIGTGIHGAAFMFVDSVKAMVHAAGALEDALHFNWGAAKGELGQALGDLKNMFNDVGDAAVGWIPKFVQGINDLAHAHANGHGVVNNAIFAAEHQSTTLDDNGPVRTPKDRGGSGRHGRAGRHGSSHGHSVGADFNFKALEDQLKPAKKSVDEFQLALDKLPKTVDGYKTAIAQLTDVIAKETVEHNALVKQQKDAHDMYEALLKVYNEFGASLGKHPTKAEKQELSDLAAQVRGAKADYDHLTTAVDNNTTALQKHQQQLIHDSAEEQRLIEEVAKKHEEAYQKMENEARKYADEVIKFFEKMGKSGKGVFADLLDAFKEMIDNMIKKFVESKLMDIFMKFMGGSAGGGSLAAGAGMLLPGISMPGFSGAGPAMVSTASGQAMAVHVSGIESSLLGTTAPGGALVGVGGGATMLGGLAGIGGGALLGGIGAGLTHGNQTNGMIGGALGVAGLALVQGGLVGGGMMGGLGSLLAAGPAGWAILAAAGLLGGVAGGMFGHKDNPALMPDKYDTAAFGQFMANLGTHNDHATSTTDQIANGSHFNIDPAIAAATQGKGEGQYIHDLIAGMSDEQGKAKFGADWDHIKAIFSGWTPGGIQLHDGSWNGFNWQDINSTAQKAMNTLGGSSAADSPIFKITRTYPDFNASTIAGATGTGGGTGTGGTGGGTGIPGVPGGHVVPPRMRGDTNDGPVVNVTIQGSVVGPGGIADVAAAISKELAKINRGQSFGAFGTSRHFGS